MNKQNNTVDYSTPIQLKLPVDLERIIKPNGPVYSFSEVMAHIDLKKYFVQKEFGYCSVRFIRKLCETDIRFIWMLAKRKRLVIQGKQNFSGVWLLCPFYSDR